MDRCIINLFLLCRVFPQILKKQRNIKQSFKCGKKIFSNKAGYNKTKKNMKNEKSVQKETQTPRVKRVRTVEEQAIWNEAKRKVKIIRTVGKMSDEEKAEWIDAIQSSMEVKPKTQETTD